MAEFEPENIVEAALRQAPVDRHLAALEAFDAHAGTRGLALAAAAGGLALARTNAAADAHALLARAGIVGDIAELHRSLPLPLKHDPGRKVVATFRNHAPNLFLVDDADEVLNLCDHAADRRRVLQLGDPADLVELQPDQRRTLRVVAADRAVGLLDLDRLCGLGHRLSTPKSARSARIVYSATVSASPPTRRDCSVETLMLRRAATERGES